ncbi:MAG: 1,4-alpha-glucan branching enzyme [Roseivirga sp.]|jgi:1,4-alpha-glucan branching enzyme
MEKHQNITAHSLFTDFDSGLFKSGKHFRLFEKLGSKLIEVDGVKGVFFAVWAPNANTVQVVGDFNHWNGEGFELYPRWDGTGIWEGFVPELKQGTVYKYKIHSNAGGQILEKGDPFALYWEVPPKTASIVWEIDYKWKDSQWLKNRKETNALNKPYSVYEVHLGSWKRKASGESLSYKELAKDLVDYLSDLEYTHVELLPVMEHPFFGSWGYQCTGFFAPSSRYGTPEDFFALMDAFHKAGIGVILDWVPSHFPSDAHGPYKFDGTHLYEHEDPRQGFHPDWNSYIFNYGRNEVRAFLISSAMYWADICHADAIRVDAVASMLYLDYSRKEGEWIPNEYGGRENLEAISFLKELNEALYEAVDGIQTIAEESTAWPSVSRPTFLGGLGFGMKWMMGWMHDTLEYFQKDPYYRQFHQNSITFSLNYAFTENFMLPLSHDEVVHGKGPLIDRMPGDEWQRFANLRLLYGYMYAHPGTKLVFMGGEIGQTTEWKHDYSLDWQLLDFAPHKGIHSFTKALNHLYKTEPALYENSFTVDGFEWIELNDHKNSVLSFIRKGNNPADDLIVLCNFTPIIRENYQIGCNGGVWNEIFNSDAKEFWGSGVTNGSGIKSKKEAMHGRPNTLKITIPPLAVVVLKKEKTKAKK